MKKIWIFLIIGLLVLGGWFILNQKTSETIQSVCEVNGWKLTPQTDSVTGNQAYMCWKAENPNIVKDSWTWNCNNGNEFVYYYENMDLNKFQSDNPLIFNFIKSNCHYTAIVE